jgi:hypothetical protein
VIAVLFVVLLGALAFCAAYGVTTLAGASDAVNLWAGVGVVAALAIFLAFDIRSSIASARAREAAEREHLKRARPIAPGDGDETWHRYWDG